MSTHKAFWWGSQRASQPGGSGGVQVCLAILDILMRIVILIMSYYQNFPKCKQAGEKEKQKQQNNTHTASPFFFFLFSFLLILISRVIFLC